MADTILKHGDKVMWDSIFLGPGGMAIVSVKPVSLEASGKTTIDGTKICVEPDFKKVKVTVNYMAPPFIIPGKGELSIKQLMPNHTTKKAKSGGKPILLKGAKFIAQFKVDKPAQIITPQGPKKDGVSEYIGFGSFQSKNKKFFGT